MVPYGVALALIFVVPVGIIKAMTGIEVTLNVLAEFIGGIWVQGNAVCHLGAPKFPLLENRIDGLSQLAMNYFKAFGYVTTAHAISFANDLKLAHYIKVSGSENVLRV